MKKLKSNFAISMLITICLLVLSLILQLIFGNIEIATFRFPINMMVLFELVVVILALHLFLRKTAIIRWLSSASAAISAILFFSIWVIIMATIPQNPKGILIFNLNDVVYTWMFATSVLFLLIALGLVVLRRITPLNLKNCSFLINHIGLWLTLSAGILGVADRSELMMQVYEKQMIWYGQDKNRKTVELPLAIRLEDFVMKSHPPKIALIDTIGKPYKATGDQLSEVTGVEVKTIDKYQISILQYFPDAKWNGVKFINAPGMPAVAPAALVNISDGRSQSEDIWIASGSYSQFPVAYPLEKNKLLALLPPEPSYFGSKVTLYSQSDSSAVSKIISVNQPVSCEGWTIYQYGYDNQLGNDSQYSTFMLVKDPWLPVVYIGIIMMMIGALLLMFTKIKVKNKEEQL
jgi:hypothetical protein